MFVGRREELRFLSRHFESEGSRLLVVYGARGVGKTRLLKEFSRDRKSAYYAARSCSDREQRCQWAGELRERGVFVSQYPEYGELFAAVLPEEREKQVLIVDEFQHLVKGEPDFFGGLVRFLDYRRLSRPVLIVLVSSAVGWVENHLVSRIGGDAAYINGFLKVRELTFPEMRCLFPEYSAGDAIQNYAVLGGSPGRWRSFDGRLNTRENLIRHVLSKESRLYTEMSVYLTEEFREPAVYGTILGAIAGGSSKLNDIYLRTGFSRAKISVYLKNLMEMDLVEKIYAGVYRIKSPYIRFYFRFLFPNLSLLEEMPPETFYEKKVEGELASFVDDDYGRICRQICGQELPEGVQAAEWVGKGAHLDIVAVDRENRRLVSLCVYGRRLEIADYKRLLSGARKAGIQVDRACLFGEYGFSQELSRMAEQGKVELRSIAVE